MYLYEKWKQSQGTCYKAATAVILFYMGQPRPLFVYVRSFQTQILHKKTEAFFKKLANSGLCLFFSNTKFTEKTVAIGGNRTQIVGVEGKQADTLTTTTTAQL